MTTLPIPSVANIRRRLAGAVEPQDQILLIGPPYKVVKDSLLRSTDVLKSLRLGDEEDGAVQQQQKRTEYEPNALGGDGSEAVSYTHLRAHET